MAADKRPPTLPDIPAAALKTILAEVKKGMAQPHACAVAGVALRTFERYCHVARRAAEDMPGWRFWRDLKIAEGKAISLQAGRIVKAGAKTWQAAAWWLERRYPEEYGSDRRELAAALKREKALEERIKTLEDRLGATGGTSETKRPAGGETGGPSAPSPAGA
jgi:hypothetical protein